MKEVIANAATQGGTALLRLEHVGKIYGNKDAMTCALDDVSLTVDRREFVAIMGPSGSGKSTLLNCIATIDTATSGHIWLAGQDITRMRGAALAKFRRDQLGFIFQDSNLLDTLTGSENIALALSVKGVNAREIPALVGKAAQELGVRDVLEKFPSQMSGGQRQRVAAARALVTDPTLILADEPTGALDSRNARIMMDCLTSMNETRGVTIVMVTHDAFAASFAHRVVFMRDGAIFNEVRRGEATRTEMFDRIMRVQAFLGGEARHDA